MVLHQQSWIVIPYPTACIEFYLSDLISVGLCVSSSRRAPGYGPYVQMGLLHSAHIFIGLRGNLQTHVTRVWYIRWMWACVSIGV